MNTNPQSPKEGVFYPRILFVFFLISLPLINPIVHGDGVGYYAYARAPVIQHNLHFEEDWRHANLNFAQSRTGPDGQLLPQEYTATGYVSNLFSVGPAILWIPFLFLAHMLVLFLNCLGVSVAANGFSFPYFLAMALGTATYGFLGLLFSFSLARKYIGEQWAFVATVAIWWGSSLPVYMYFNPSWSHAHSAFVVALFLWYWERTRPARTTRQWLLLGLISGLMIDVYFPNAVFLLLPLIESLSDYPALAKTQHQAAFRLFLDNVLFVFMIALAFLPTIITRRIIFGGYFNFGRYSNLEWDWSAPNWLAVLFSSNHGLFSWTLLLPFALLGIVFVPRHARIVAWYLGIATLAFYYLISSYPFWHGMSSYGNRFFISLTPIYVFGLAALLQRVAGFFARPRVAMLLLSAVLSCFVLWNLGLIYQWGAHLIPARGPVPFRELAYNQFHVVPREISGHLRSYVFHRSDLMRKIEEKDIEQLKKGSEP